MASQFQNGTIGDIVSSNYQAAAVFERFGLDFCCGGRVSLAEACRQRHVDVSAVVGELVRLQEAPVETGPREPAELAAHISARHHSYVRNAIPIIAVHLAKVVAVHGERHPELAAIAAHFEIVAHDLVLHMMKEEQVLFPYITALAKAAQSGGPPPPDMFGTVQNPIRMMEIEHQHAGEELATIRALSSGYEPPPDACTTFRVVYEELRAFEQDLHLHVHLENNVLFPAAVALEAQVSRNGRIGCEPRQQHDSERG
jgi:regulator of cell morphogenesis and NO signaling